MTTIETSIDASLDILQENVDIMSDWWGRKDIDMVLLQAISCKTYLGSFINFLQRQKKREWQE